MICELMFYEHKERGDTRCPDDAEHTAALARRRAGAAPWFPIVPGQDGGGARDYLDNRPINCGIGLILQSIEEREDDYGGYTLPLNEGVRVRYERGGDSIVLFTSLGGHEVTLAHAPWMRFHWPERR